jgi:hypothetical protein
MQEEAEPWVRCAWIVYQLALLGVTHGARRLELDDDAVIDDDFRPIDARSGDLQRAG